jgi:cytochrome b subunit of formate dehydrogenase
MTLAGRASLASSLTARVAVCLFALALLAPAAGFAQAAESCLLCHGRALSKSVQGRVVSLQVEQATFQASVHGTLACTACHRDLAGAGIPHASPATPVRCGQCHAQAATAHEASLHGQALAAGDTLAPSCLDCHGKHDIRSSHDPNSRTAVFNVPTLCGGCHREGSPVTRTHDILQDRILANYSMSIHGEGLFKQGLKVTAVCTSCHTAHDVRPHTDPTSSTHRGRIAATCAQCHARIEQVHRKVIEGRLWQEEPHKIPACVDCHAPHKIRRALYPAGAANADCLTCHGDQSLTMGRDGQPVSLFVDHERYGRSAHAEVACAQCHTEVDPSHDRACETVRSRVDCSICHAEQVDRHRESTHGTLAANNDPDAPTCATCHGVHYTGSKKLPESPTFARNVHTLCGDCHRAGQRAAVRAARDRGDIVGYYEDSIHGKGLVESGLLVAATCTDCHGSHDELPADDPRSTVSRGNVARTCGRCHDGIEKAFRASVHAAADAATTREKKLPECADCHSSHTISRTDRGDFRLRMMDQCGRCHAGQAETFFETFHGKVSRLGSEGAAKCSDCHGTHGILPADDPRSTLSHDNVVATCGACHPGSHRQFAGYLTHATHHDPDKYPWLFWSFWGMTFLLVGTLAVAFLHALAWLVRLWLNRGQWRAHRRAMREQGPPGKVYRRFDGTQRLQHLALLVSFFILALTGMALKFSYMGWAQGISRALGGFEAMGVLHRLGAIVLFGVFVFHLWDVRRRKRLSGQTWLQLLGGPNSILFNRRDWPELVQSVKWFFGLGPRPAYGRFTYWEKFDYFAVFWGVMVIGSTGLVLWFPETFTYLLPGWSVNVATIIHSDEALLAVGFIFTIHFFNGHFRPDKFPMDPVIFTGRMTVEELKYDKPGEYRALVEAGALEAQLVEPIAAPTERAARVFGLLALAIGLTLIALILYAMLFGYR